jgi:N-acyl-D-aspartate/D-glutamate deacylase
LNDIIVLESPTAKNKSFENRTLAEIAQMTGKSPVDVMLDMAVEDDLRTVFHAPDSSNGLGKAAERELVDYQWLLPGISDGGAHTKFYTGGTYGTDFITYAMRASAR